MTKVELHYQSQEHSCDTQDCCCVDWVNETRMVFVNLQRDRELPPEHGNNRCRSSSSGAIEESRQVASTLSNGLRPQTIDSNPADYKHKSRLVICGNFAAWGEHSTATTNLDAPLLRLMLSLSSSPDTTWSSIDITSAFLNADIHEDDTVLVTPPQYWLRWTLSNPTPSGV